jgi:ATP-binding cassette subfamily B protein
MQKEENKGSEAKNLRNFFNLFVNIYRIFMMAFRFMPWHTVGMILLTIVIGATPIFAFKAMGSLIDTIIAGAKSGILGAVWVSLLVYAVLNILPALASNTRRFVERVWYMRLQDYFDLMTLKKRGSFDIAQFEDTKFLDFMQRAFNQSYYPLLNVLDGSIDLMQYVVGILVGSVAAFVIDWQVFVLVIVTAIPTFVIEVKYGSQIWHLFYKNSPEQRRSQDLRRFFSTGNKYSVIDGKLYQVGEKFLKIIKKIQEDFTNSQLKTEHRRTAYSILATIIAGVGLFIGTAMIIKSAIAGVIAIGTVVYAFQTLSRVSGQAQQLLNQIAKMMERNLYVTDIFKVMDMKPSLIRPKNAKKINLEVAPNIVFENVSFKYPSQDKYALKNVSLEIKSGEKLGLVGNNGSGKSTIVRLLLRIHDPNEGRILINGIDLRELDLDEWWSYLGVLLQDFITYNFSVKESVAVGRSDKNIDMVTVEKATKQSTSNSFVDKLEKKYDHMIGVEFGGIEPSKGQRQKLAIARALYRTPHLLILDEPTASIDSESASIIFNEIESLPENTSAILISHNFATIKRASKIIVLENGSIREHGTHEELVNKNGVYAEAFNKQKKEFE